MMRKHQNGIADAKANHNSEKNRIEILRFSEDCQKRKLITI